MDKVAKKFNSWLENWLDQAKILFPQNERIAQLTNVVSVVNKAKPTAIIKRFAEQIHPWRDIIEARDEQFITVGCKHMDYVKDIGIDATWHTLSPRNKDVMWQYLEKLSALCAQWDALAAPPDPAPANLDPLAMVSQMMVGGGGNPMQMVQELVSSDSAQIMNALIAAIQSSEGGVDGAIDSLEDRLNAELDDPNSKLGAMLAKLDVDNELSHEKIMVMVTNGMGFLEMMGLDRSDPIHRVLNDIQQLIVDVQARYGNTDINKENGKERFKEIVKGLLQHPIIGDDGFDVTSFIMSSPFVSKLMGRFMGLNMNNAMNSPF